MGASAFPKSIVMRLAVSILLVFIHSLSFGDELAQHTSPNGCGAGWSLLFVPNSIPLAKCQFKEACDNHDLCYGKCENSFAEECEYRRCRKGGDLYGDIQCLTDERLVNLIGKAEERRRKCDDELCDEIIEKVLHQFHCENFFNEAEFGMLNSLTRS